MSIKTTCFRLFASAMIIVVAGCLYNRSSDNIPQLPEYIVLNLEHPNHKPIFMQSPPGAGWTDDYKTKMMVFKLIRPGQYLANLRGGEKTFEGTCRKVFVENAFYIGIFEVTRKQWEMVCGEVPEADPTYLYSPQWQIKQPDWETRPVVAALCDVWSVTFIVKDDGHVEDDPTSWSFFGKLRKMFPEMEITLPTEDEWEYACRAGTDAPYAVTNANGARLGYFGNVRGTPKVGTYPPNKWGLYDMNGSVAEWCSTLVGYNENVIRGEDTCSSRTQCSRGSYGLVHYGVRVKLQLRR
ncbi:MAG: SUMF1/EgtB/PvdO family nonheme iron enzyme [Kiritimatiellae bacterium]|nr:SUMF1/EgtB/PvdO family nonheme iron enzyme [Kiritimatiellia bacterium]